MDYKVKSCIKTAALDYCKGEAREGYQNYKMGRYPRPLFTPKTWRILYNTIVPTPFSSRFQTSTLTSHPQADQVCQVLEAALQAADPAAAVARHLNITEPTLTVGDRAYDLDLVEDIYLVGAGKAGAPMALTAAAILADRLTAGLVIVKEGYEIRDTPGLSQHQIVTAGHPLPDQRGVKATQELLSLLARANANDLILCLLSGGASALLTAPAAGITLPDLQHLTSLLLRSGADIGEINTLRKHLDIVKGGGLVQAAAPARVISLILSDVIGDPLDIIASGPTAADSSTFTQALNILRKYGLSSRVAPAILTRLEQGAAGIVAETLKPGDPLMNQVQNLVIGSNRQAARSAAQTAATLGFNTRLLSTALQGEARLVGSIMAQAAHDLAGDSSPLPRPACLIAGGETTVTVRGDGLGGRNQELALAAVETMNGLADTLLITLATDGGDGPTDAAGALVSGETLARAQALGLDPAEHLVRNDAYPFFDALGDLLKPGPTFTNVNDLVFLFTF